MATFEEIVGLTLEAFLHRSAGREDLRNLLQLAMGFHTIEDATLYFSGFNQKCQITLLQGLPVVAFKIIEKENVRYVLVSVSERIELEGKPASIELIPTGSASIGDEVNNTSFLNGISVQTLPGEEWTPISYIDQQLSQCKGLQYKITINPDIPGYINLKVEPMWLGIIIWSLTHGSSIWDEDLTISTISCIRACWEKYLDNPLQGLSEAMIYHALNNHGINPSPVRTMNIDGPIYHMVLAEFSDGSRTAGGFVRTASIARVLPAEGTFDEAAAKLMKEFDSPTWA